MKVITVVGARPQFVKAAVVSHALREAGIDEIIVHTGQHYDPLLSQAFFSELGLPEPDVNLGVGSGSHAVQTGTMMVGLEAILRDKMYESDAMIVFGDTNSTLAAAIVAAKAGLPIAHVEAGLRSFNRRMPEELNRLVTDSLSTWLFCPTRSSFEQLEGEGHSSGLHLTGDVMYEATLRFSIGAIDPYDAMSDRAFGVLTLHRAENTDDPVRLNSIMQGVGELNMPILFPVHPRTKNRLKGISLPANITMVDPVGYRSMLSLVRRAEVVLTDSGGLQKESVWLGTRCITLRDETEWVETLEGRWNQLVGADPEKIQAAVERSTQGPAPTFGYVDGRFASEYIVEVLGH